jgi:flagellar basal body-associated protein FliL
MDNNPVIPQYNSQLPQMTQPKSNFGRNLVMIISAVLIVVVIAATGYLLVLGNAKKTAYNNVQSYIQPTLSVSPKASPTPSVYQINPKDTTDSAINNDTTVANQNLDSLDTDLNNVDQSFNDQQTNLQ